MVARAPDPAVRTRGSARLALLAALARDAGGLPYSLASNAHLGRPLALSDDQVTRGLRSLERAGLIRRVTLGTNPRCRLGVVLRVRHDGGPAAATEEEVGAAAGELRSLRPEVHEARVAAKALTPMQQAFVSAYRGNATEAARQAGYRQPRSAGCRLIRDRRVCEAAGVKPSRPRYRPRPPAGAGVLELVGPGRPPGSATSDDKP